MKKLIIYDADCPMCRAYTKGLAAINKDLERIPNNAVTDASILNRLDYQRARHEIPMVDLNGGETLYGVDTWLYLLGERGRILGGLSPLRWLKRLLNVLYAFISYNRRIIVPVRPGRWSLLELQPEFHLSYRLLFIGLVFGLVAGLHYVCHGMVPWLAPVLLGLQIGLVSAYLYVTKHPDFTETLLDYCGHAGMSLLLGGFILTMGLTTGWLVLLPIGYALTVGQHFIRSYNLGLNPWLSVSFTVIYLSIAGL
ncbi:hypothetical protein DYU11_28505 [Fibrisoma montanum]|uniref:DUF393 domain-containing protein n=1 Tax=Fibrisoma montanum TaxID=2305895 RepID=A0A418LZ26_9BACT|nr:hypothetical protein [Fibrisoma montanum]RIV18516.1 hypothetical protein DYU11_28505 [Fibrisoma montanum]